MANKLSDAFEGDASALQQEINRLVEENSQLHQKLQLVSDSEHWYRDLFDSAHIGLYRVEAESGQFIACNHQFATMLGYASVEACLTSPGIAQHFQTPNYQDIYHQITQDTDLQNIEVELRQTNDSLFWVNCSLRYTASDGYIEGVVIDVSQQKELEGERIDFLAARKRTEVLQAFLSGASHDIKTPLSNMKTSVYLLRKIDDPDKKQRYLDVLEEQSTHIESLLEDMLNMSRLEELRDMQVEPLKLNTLVHVSLSQHLHQIKRKNHEFQYQPHPQEMLVLGNALYLNLALSKIIMNAINFTPENGTITVRTNYDDGIGIVSVEDGGIGIAPDDIPHVFEYFYKADNARSSSNGKSGLGLPIALRIITAHNGDLWLDSELGKGTSAYIALPLYTD